MKTKHQTHPISQNTMKPTKTMKPTLHQNPAITQQPNHKPKNHKTNKNHEITNKNFQNWVLTTFQNQVPIKFQYLVLKTVKNIEKNEQDGAKNNL